MADTPRPAGTKPRAARKTRRYSLAERERVLEELRGALEFDLEEETQYAFEVALGRRLARGEDE